MSETQNSLCANVFIMRLTDARSDRRAALLVALGAAVTGDSCDSVLAGTLACCLIACLPCCSNWMAITSCGTQRERETEKHENIKWKCVRLNTL